MCTLGGQVAQVYFASAPLQYGQVSLAKHGEGLMIGSFGQLTLPSQKTVLISVMSFLQPQHVVSIATWDNVAPWVGGNNVRYWAQTYNAMIGVTPEQQYYKKPQPLGA